MNQTLKTGLVVLAALLVFKVLDKLFIDSMVNKIGNFEEGYED